VKDFAHEFAEGSVAGQFSLLDAVVAVLGVLGQLHALGRRHRVGVFEKFLGGQLVGAAVIGRLEGGQSQDIHY
jgi:hypothetical protein